MQLCNDFAWTNKRNPFFFLALPFYYVERIKEDLNENKINYPETSTKPTESCEKSITNTTGYSIHYRAQESIDREIDRERDTEWSVCCFSFNCIQINA